MNDLSPSFGKNLQSIVFSSESTTRQKGLAKRSGVSSEETIQADLEALHGRVRKEFGYKRKDIAFDLAEANTGRLTTPDFEYSIRVQTTADNPHEQTWTREFGFKTKGEALYDERALSLFGDELDTIILTFSSPIDIASLIDRIEDSKSGKVTLDYDLQCKWCELSLEGVPATVRLEGRSLSLRRQPGTQISVSEMLSLIEPGRFGLT